jgi:HD-like signal output (HDOD) protein
VLTSLARALEDPKLDMTEVGDIIASDMGITAKVLQLVNNGQFFGAGGVVADPRKAADLLGQAIVQSLVSTLDMLEQTEAMGIDIEVLEEHWTHGLEVGVLARQIAARESADDAFAGEAFTAGLLHDVGKIILLANTVEYEALLSKYGADEDEMHLCEAEEAAFGVTHAQVGAYLLGIWGFPDSIVEAVLYHHKPRASKQTVFSPLTAVHVANSVDYWLSNGSESQLGPSYCQIYLDRVGCGNKMNAWLMLGDVSKAEGLFGQALRHST